MKRTLVNLSFAICGGLVALLATQRLPLSAKEPVNPKIVVQDTPINRDLKITTSFAPVIKKNAPSVVNIFTTKKVTDTIDPRANPFFNDPFFRRFFGDDPENTPRSRPRSRQEQSLGSGVIVSEEGYILTNNHVVEGADEIKVVLTTGQEFTAKVIGTDPPTDLAVLKIDGSSLPAIVIANSDQVEVGDVVLAIGNPFGIGQTVTMGIVSGVGRGGFGIVDYEDFIQTDASINPGNSGGALVDAEGRLIAINTAILSRSGGNQGVGFAVPINMARVVMERILKDGKVTRGYLGVGIQPITPELAKEFGLKDQSGALVGGVNDDTPAGKAGIEAGDVIVEFNGKKVTDSRHLRLMVSQTPPGTEVTVKILRNGKEKNFKTTLAELPTDELAAAPGMRRTPSGAPESETLEGVEVADLDSRNRRQYNIPNNVRGALVTKVEPDSAAAEAGLSPGDVIQEINRKPVTSADEAIELSEKVTTQRILVRVWSRGFSRYLTVDSSRDSNKK